MSIRSRWFRFISWAISSQSRRYRSNSRVVTSRGGHRLEGGNNKDNLNNKGNIKIECKSEKKGLEKDWEK